MALRVNGDVPAARAALDRVAEDPTAARRLRVVLQDAGVIDDDERAR